MFSLNFDTSIFLTAGMVLLGFAIAGWVVSLIKNDVSIVDSLWSLMILLAGIVFYMAADTEVTRAGLVLALVAIWALRLSGYITWRNHGEEEDQRYQQIRANNQPHFKYKSVYIVFGLQAFLAWMVALPLLATATGTAPGLNALDYIALLLWLVGMFFEVVGDWQMTRFKADPDSKGKVMDSGLWHYTRHPNYFGECCIWWAFFLFALSAGGGWSIVSPLIMTFLLLKVSGVAMLEKDIAERRPKYKDYIERTPAFFPWWPKSKENGA